ncbi:MAG: DMT family transporter [Pseudomonadota bacterium]
MTSIAKTSINSGYLFACTAALIWAGFIIVSRHGGVSGLTAYDVIAIRYLTCSAIVLPILLIWRPFNLFQRRLVVSSLVGGLAYAVFAFIGFSGAPASHAAVLLPGLMPAFIYLFSVLLKQDRINRQKTLGISVITIGITLLVIDLLMNGAKISMFHISLSLSAICWSIYSVLIRRWSISPWEATVSLAVWTLIFYLPVYIAFLPSNLTEVEWSIIATQSFYQGFVATIIQMLCYVKAVQLIGASSMGSIMGFVPLVAGFAAIPIFDEKLTAGLALALVLVSSGVWLSNKSPKKR